MKKITSKKCKARTDALEAAKCRLALQATSLMCEAKQIAQNIHIYWASDDGILQAKVESLLDRVVRMRVTQQNLEEIYRLSQEDKP